MVIGGVRSRTLSLQPGTTYFGARLLPVPLAPHSLIPVKKLANSCVPLGEFLPARLCSMLRLPLEGGSFFSRISLFQEGITRVTALAPLGGDREPKGLGPAIDRICEARGNISLSHLSGMLNCSSRHFRSLFEAYVGSRPRRFAKSYVSNPPSANCCSPVKSPSATSFRNPVITIKPILSASSKNSAANARPSG